MKKMFLIFIISFSSLAIKSQDLSADSLQKRIETLEETLNKEYFVQVPKKDFEKTLETTVKDEIDNWVNSRRIAIITLWGILSFLLGFLLKYYFTENYRKQIDQKINEETRSLNERTSNFIKEMSQKFNDYVDSANTKFSNLSDDISHKGTIIDKHVLKIEEIITEIQNKQNGYFSTTREHIENKINSTLGFIWDDIVDDNIRKAKDRNYMGDDLIKTLNKLLETEEIKLSESKQIDLIDCLIRCYYNKQGTEGKFGDIMISVVEKYDKTLKLKPETFATIAIKACNYYEYYGTQKFREATQLYCNNSINMLPDYGIPYTVLLELFMIDYKSSNNDDEKRKAVANINDTFKNINKNKSNLLPIEIIERIKEDEQSYLKEYLQELMITYPLELNDIRERALQSLLLNYELTLKSEKDKKVLEYILDYGLTSNQVIIDGSWELIESVESGITVPVNNVKEMLSIKDYVFNIISGMISKTGILYFLTGTDPLSINFYFSNPTKIEKGIYKLENENLIICYSINGNKPADFSSTIDSKNSYKVYKRPV